MISVSQFRKDIKAFASAQRYTNDSVTYWLSIANLLLNQGRWGSSAADPWPGMNPPPLAEFDFGCELFVAHNLALEDLNNQTAQNGGTPGTSAIGPASSEKVDKVSVTYSIEAGIEPDAGHWNLTNYGTRFIQLARLLGAGPLYVGAGATPSGLGNGYPFPGPNIYPPW